MHTIRIVREAMETAAETTHSNNGMRIQDQAALEQTGSAFMGGARHDRRPQHHGANTPNGETGQSYACSISCLWGSLYTS